MFESLLILTAGGVLLAAAVPRPADVRPAWLRLAGVVALACAVLGASLAAARGDLVDTPAFFRRVQAGLVALAVLAAVTHLVCVWRRQPRVARVAGVAGFGLALLAGSNLLHDAMLTRGTALAFPPKAFAMTLQTLAAAGASSVVGFMLMVAAFPVCGVAREEPQVGARAFRRLYRCAMTVVLLRAVVAVGGVLLLHAARPVPRLWADHGPLISARWLVGLVAVPVLAALAPRRFALGRPLSATAMLVAAALLAIDAEAVALYLVRETGLPF
jgi:hypothetical protein